MAGALKSCNSTYLFATARIIQVACLFYGEYSHPPLKGNAYNAWNPKAHHFLMDGNGEWNNHFFESRFGENHPTETTIIKWMALGYQVGPYKPITELG